MIMKKNGSIIQNRGVSLTPSSRRADANEVMWFKDELTSFDTEEYMVLRNELSLFKYIPIKEVEKGMDVYEYKMFEGNGRSKIITAANGKAKDIPSLSVGGKQFKSPIFDLGIQLEFSDRDLILSASTKRDKIKMQADQALRSNWEAMNLLGFYGDASLALPGLLNNVQVAPIAPTTDYKLAGTTPAQMYANLILAYNTIRTNTKGTITPDTALCAPALFYLLDTTVFNTVSGLTVRQQFENAQSMKMYAAPELAGAEINAYLGGNTWRDSILMYKNSPTFISSIVSNFFEMGDLQKDGLLYTSIALSSFGGVINRQPAGTYLQRNQT